MRSWYVEGRAVASFVVDTLGVVVPESAIITSESQPAFGNAVCSWLRQQARFEPFVVNGRKYTVRIANYPVDFTLTR